VQGGVGVGCWIVLVRCHSPLVTKVFELTSHILLHQEALKLVEFVIGL
jgi:hypothetical protein